MKKKQLLLTFAIAVLTGTTLGCSQNKNVNQPTSQEAKKELSNEEIVKTSLSNFSKEKNLELDTKVNIKSNFMAEGYSVNVLSNIKIDDSGNVLKKFSEQETELGKTTTKEEHIFLKKNNSGYDKFNVENGKLVPGIITDDLEVLSAIQVFFNGNTLFNTITDKNYEKSDNKLTFSGKIKLSDIGNKFYLSPGTFSSEEAGDLSNMTLSFIATIDTTTNEVLTITLDLKSFIEDMAKKQLEKEKDSMSQLEYTTAKTLMESILKDTQGEISITRKIDKIDEIKFD